MLLVWLVGRLGLGFLDGGVLMAAPPPRRIRCSLLRPRRRASSPGDAEECVESVLYRSSLPVATSGGGDDF